MALHQSPEGAFYITGVKTTKADTAGGKNGFPVWTRQKYEAREEKLKAQREKTH